MPCWICTVAVDAYKQISLGLIGNSCLLGRVLINICPTCQHNLNIGYLCLHQFLQFKRDCQGNIFFIGIFAGCTAIFSSMSGINDYLPKPGLLKLTVFCGEGCKNQSTERE